MEGGLLTSNAAHEAQRVLDAVPVIIIYESKARTLARQIADAAKRHDIYDATYPALAMARDCELWTADKRLYNVMQNEARGVYPVRLVDVYTGEFRKQK